MTGSPQKVLGREKAVNGVENPLGRRSGREGHGTNTGSLIDFHPSFLQTVETPSSTGTSGVISKTPESGSDVVGQGFSTLKDSESPLFPES